MAAAVTRNISTIQFTWCIVRFSWENLIECILCGRKVIKCTDGPIIHLMLIDMFCNCTVSCLSQIQN